MTLHIWLRSVALLLAPAMLLASSPSTLREAADESHLLVGTAVRPSMFSEAAYSATLAREFNMVEPEDVMKWWVVRRNAGAFDFREGDEVVRFARTHRMKVRGHCLVWDHNNPEWLVQGHFTPAQLSGLLQEHITRVMKHYAGQVFAWDVVNEALDEKGHVKDSPWYNQPGIGLSGKGTGYIEQAFRWAREADPQALLFYNDNGGEGLNPKSDAIYAMVKDFKRHGVPIDGVGLQLHISQVDLDTAAIATNIKRLTALDIQVHITELDVSLPLEAAGGAENDNLLRQAEVYRAYKIQAALRFKPGDSPTNTRGSDRTRTARAAQPSRSTAPTSPNPPTTPCSKRFPISAIECTCGAGSIDPAAARRTAVLSPAPPLSGSNNLAALRATTGSKTRSHTFLQ
jgi:endo-1,4-beta-xylanase